MKHSLTLIHKFVDHIPEDIKDGEIYISILFKTAVHKCCCGCGKEVVTPLSPTGWELTFNGETTSLYPSIGNWSFECQSHYWISHNRVEWSYRFSKRQIELARDHDQLAKKEYFNTIQTDQGDNIKKSKRVKRG